MPPCMMNKVCRGEQVHVDDASRIVLARCVLRNQWTDCSTRIMNRARF